jgi:hypothetical protein
MTFSTTRVQQIEHYGEKDEQRLAPDEGSGYLWRLISFARFEERDGGLYLEFEVIGLSKDLPGSLRLLLKPLIDHVPRQALTVKLEQTRQAIRSRASQRASALVFTARLGAGRELGKSSQRRATWPSLGPSSSELDGAPLWTIPCQNVPSGSALSADIRCSRLLTD